MIPRGRVRALSTGSISSSHAHEEHLQMESSTDALLLSGSKPQPPPKPKRKVSDYEFTLLLLKCTMCASIGSIASSDQTSAPPTSKQTRNRNRAREVRT